MKKAKRKSTQNNNKSKLTGFQKAVRTLLGTIRPNRTLSQMEYEDWRTNWERIPWGSMNARDWEYYWESTGKEKPQLPNGKIL